MIYVLIPTFNEEKNILNLYNSFKNLSIFNDLFFVFVDDASEDMTIDKINEFFSTNSYIIQKKTNIGPGNSFNIGFKWILDHCKKNDEVIVTMEADCTSDISIFEKLIKVQEIGFDLVLASPYAQGGGFQNTSLFRKVVSFLANMIFRFFFNIKVLTLSSFYRVYSIDMLKHIEYKYGDVIKEDGFICKLELLLKAIRLNYRIVEIPMRLNSDNREGKSKMKVFKTSMAYFKFLIYSVFRPLK